MNEEKTIAPYVATVIEACQKAVGSIKTELANINAKYKKLQEEETASLNEQLDEVNEQLHFWYAVRGDIPMPEKKTRKPRSKKTAEVPQPEPAQVVDTVFPENNEPEGAAEPEAKENMEIPEGITPMEEVSYTEPKIFEPVPLKAAEVPFPENNGMLWPSELAESPTTPEESVSPEELEEPAEKIDEQVVDPFADIESDDEEKELGLSDEWPAEVKEWV